MEPDKIGENYLMGELPLFIDPQVDRGEVYAVQLDEKKCLDYLRQHVIDNQDRLIEEWKDVEDQRYYEWEREARARIIRSAS